MVEADNSLSANVAAENDHGDEKMASAPPAPGEERAEEEEFEMAAASPPEEEAPKKQSFMNAARSKALRPFVIISTSYLLFTITDGAIRMIVLLEAYQKNFSALAVAIMFTLYEFASVFTNVLAGLLGARWGIRFTLVSGLAMQLLSYGLLFGWKESWSKEKAVIYVTVALLFGGVAKDLTKLGGKTVTKLVTPDEQNTKLFKLVSLITGWKNSLKGVGYFLGSGLIEVNYYSALAVMMGLVLLAMPWAILGLDRSLGTAKKRNALWSEIFDFENTNLNWLSLARLFLFASRDVWFEVPLPYFLRSPPCSGLGPDFPCSISSDCGPETICSDNGFCVNRNPRGGCGGLGMKRFAVGAVLGGVIMMYGQVQSWTPQLVTGPLKQSPPNKYTEIFWGLINCIPSLVAWAAFTWATAFQNHVDASMIAWIVLLVIAFSVIFAINSSIHSYLVVKYASKEKIAVSVGFYYMSNAIGRLLGTLGSGVLYTYVGPYLGPYEGLDGITGIAACFLAGTIMSFLAAAITVMINDNKSGLKCGRLTLIPATEEETVDEEPEEREMKVKDEEENVPVLEENGALSNDERAHNIAS